MAKKKKKNTVQQVFQRRRHLSSKVFYRYKSASREIVYHRKSVSKLILLLSPIKCHFALQCFSSSVILKRISIETATIATAPATATEHHQTAMIYCVWCIWVCRWRWRKPFTAIVLGHVFMCVFVYVYIYFADWLCMCKSDESEKDEKKKMKNNNNNQVSIPLFVLCEWWRGMDMGLVSWLVCWCVNEWIYTYVCTRFCICALSEFSVDVIVFVAG